MSQTTHEIVTAPATYGGYFVGGGAVQIEGSADVGGKTVQYLIDDTVVGESPLIYAGSGQFVPLLRLTTQPGAGEHTFSMRFPGAPATAHFPAVAPSQSEPTSFTVAQAPTTTVITSAPTTMTAFSAIDVTATVKSTSQGVSGVTGTATLLADGSPIQSADLAHNGSVTFSGAEVPWGTSALTVAFTGDAAGNWATSVSEEAAIIIEPLGTSGTLSLSSHHIRAIDEVAVALEVRAGGLGSQVDPRGGIEIFLDGQSVYAETSADDGSAMPGDGITRFDVVLSDIAPGEHIITASYMPTPGFGAAEIAPVELTSSAVGTSLAPASDEVQGTLENPAVIDVTVGLAEPESDDDGTDVGFTRSAAASGGPASVSPKMPTESFAPSGTVQAFIGDRPIGDPFAVTDGSGRGTLAGLSSGTHEVELRFIPDIPGLLPSSAAVTVKVAAANTPGSTPVSTPRPSAALAQTGGPAQAGLVLGGAALLLGAGTALTVARLRRR